MDSGTTTKASRRSWSWLQNNSLSIPTCQCRPLPSHPWSTRSRRRHSSRANGTRLPRRRRPRITCQALPVPVPTDNNSSSRLSIFQPRCRGRPTCRPPTVEAVFSMGEVPAEAAGPPCPRRPRQFKAFLWFRKIWIRTMQRWPPFRTVSLLSEFFQNPLKICLSVPYLKSAREFVWSWIPRFC